MTATLGEARASIAEAHAILDRTDVTISGRWPRAAAALCRTSIEQAVRTLWKGPNACLLECNGKVQMLCLPEYLTDDRRDLALRTHLAWKSLSNALHVDAGYELAPTAGELASWCHLAEELILAVEEQA